MTLGESVKHRSILYQGAKQQVDELATSTGECIHLFSWDEEQGFIFDESYGEKAVGTRLHDRLREEPYQHLYCSAGGKAILAHLSDEQVDEIIDRHTLEPMAKNTITNRDDLFDDLQAVLERGFALNDEELIRGQRAVGVTILDADEMPLGAVSLSAPKSRLDGRRFREETPELLSNTANVSELDIQTAQMEL